LNSSSLFTKLNRYAPGIFLALLLALQGGKTPLPFFVWSSICLAFITWAFLKDRETFLKAFSPSIILIATLLAASFIFSLDPSSSLFQTLQLFVFLILWVWLRSHPEGTRNPFYWRVWILLGLATLGITIFQISRGRNEAGLYDIFGFLPHNPSFNAVWMATLAVVFIGRFLNKNHASTKQDVVEGVLGFVFAALVFFNPVYTRSAPLALSVALIYLFCLRYSIKRVFVATALLVAVTIACMPQDYLEARLRISGDHGEPNYRTQIWKIAIHSMRDRPLTGYGLGNFEMGYQKHAFPVEDDFVRFARTTAFAHNEYLQVSAELGFPLFCAVLYLLLLTLFRRRNTVATALHPAMKAACIVLSLDAFFNFTWHMPFLLFVTLLVCAPLHPSINTLRPYQRRLSASPFVIPVFVSWIVITVMLLGIGVVRSTWASRSDWAKIVRINPFDAAAWKELGDQMPIGSESIKAYQRAVSLAPSNSYFHEALAFALEKSPHAQDQDLAIHHYLQALEKAPQRAHLAYALGRLAYQRKDLRGALSWFERAIRVEPHYWEAHLGVARCQFRLGQRQKAIHTLRLIPVRHAAFTVKQNEVLKGVSFYHPSGYEKIILSYDPKVIQDELRQFMAFEGKGYNSHGE
jgi:O-antigen ligase